MTTTPSSANSSSCLGFTSYADAKSRKTSSTSSHAMTTKNCKLCKKNLQGRRRVWCSKSCERRSHYLYIVKQKFCENCNKQFAVQGRTLRKKFCSKKCSQESNSSKYRLARRKSTLKSYNINFEIYEALLQIQDGRCAICRKHEVINQHNKTRHLAIDHCHETKNTRGLLCGKCNMALGLFEDNWLILDNAMEYLSYWHNKHGSSKVQSIQEVPSLN